MKYFFLHLFSNDENKILKAIKKYQHIDRNFIEGKLVAELNLGFWTGLYHSPYIEINKNTIKVQFPFATNKERNIFKLKTKLESIRKLRNRIFHFEPIWQLEDVGNLFQDICKMLHWLGFEKSYLDEVVNTKQFLETYRRQELFLK